MATVQAAVPMANMPGAGLPANVTQEQAQQVYMRYKQLQAAGTPATDPEFQRAHQFLSRLQLAQRARGYQANNNGAAPSVSTGQNGPISSAPGPAVSGPQGASNLQASQFSQQHVALLKQQINAFKSLSKNLSIPVHVQHALMGQRQRRQASTTQATTAAATGNKNSSSDGVNGASIKDVVAPLDARLATFKSLSAPEKLLETSINYFEHAQRRKRLFVPGIFPTGIDFDHLRAEREKIIFNRMSARYNELKSLPGDMAHWDTTKENLELDDTLKRKAIIEMKSLALYSKQRLLRDKVAASMMAYDNLAMTTNRSAYRRVKKQSVREARVTEKLEKQQRDARENREKKQHSDHLRAVLNHRAEINATAVAHRNKMLKVGRLMYNHHFNIEKEEQKRIERTAKQRLQALKNNDEEAYLKLLDQAKDTRITHLLRQTDGFLTQLASSVKAQQRAAAERYGDELGDGPEEEEEEDEEDEETNRSKIDYYAIAHRVKEEVTGQANMLVGGTLKEYQVKGLQWMISLYNNNLNGILADEMGLGKTIQTISLITYLIERKQQNGPYLVIVPLSTLTNWINEFEKWAPSVSKIVYKGPPPARKLQQDKIRQGRFQVLLTTYEYIIKDRNVLAKIKWFHMIIDEGHRMKNANSKLSATIQQNYATRFRLILTGTPLQNNLAELWAMLNFTLPTIFKSATTFDEWFNTPFANTGGQDKMELTEEEQILVIRRLHKVLRPFLLRRLKKDVEKDLPDKTEKVIKCKFSALQARLYKQMVTHNKLVVSDGKGGKTGARGLSNMIMQLRKLCNHPYVFPEVENQMNPRNVIDDDLWRTSGKFELLERILPKYRATGHRVLMFFQMTAIMDIMEEFLRYRGITFLRLDGTTKAEDRSELLRDFNRPDSPYFMFLLSTRAGGLGLNLQTADTVIIYDSDWNPHQDLQAQDRAHRIGQKNEVRILRLISSNSVEEKILDRARYKLDMDGKVIQAGRFDNKSSETDRDAMLRTLLETAELADTMEQEDMEDEELNMILARSDEELVTFGQMDEAKSKDMTYGTIPGAKHRSRLMTDAELPEIYLSDGNPVSDEPEMILGRGARERTRVKYDDGLTEEQWLLAVDDDDDSPEAAAARKAARKEKRAINRARREGGDGADLLDDDDDSSDDGETGTPVKKQPQQQQRGRKTNDVKVDKRKADEGEEEPPAKKRRGANGRAKAVPSANGSAGAMRVVLRNSMRRIHDSIMKIEVDDEEADDDDKDEDGDLPKRLIIGPFVKLPSKRDYGDYYASIKDPICMNQIDKKIKKDEYNTLADMQRDVALLCRNAQTYNEDGSLLYGDATTILKFCTQKIHDELASHPELLEVENGSQEDSTAPTTSHATPQPSSGPLRIKLTNNAALNGGNSTLPTEDEDD